MIIGVFVINLDGDVLVHKPFMSSAHPWSPEKFYKSVLTCNAKHVISPCLQIDKLYYMHLKKGEVYIVTVLESSDIASFLMVESLNKFVKECSDLIGELTSRNIIDHVAVVYELVINIFGLCQPGTISINSVNECKQLGDVEPPENIISMLPENLFSAPSSKENQYVKAGSASKVPLASGTEKSSDLYLDLKEHLSVIIDSKGQTIFTDVTGNISTKSYLTSPVKLLINLSDKVVSNEKSEPGKINIIAKRSLGTKVEEINDFPAIKHLSYPGHSDILDYQIDASHLSLPFTMYHNFTKSKRGSMVELFLNCKIFCSLPAGISPSNWSGTLPLPSKLHSVRAVSSLQSMTFSEDKRHEFLTFQTENFPSQSHHSISITLLLYEQLPHMRYQMPFLNIQFDIGDVCISSMNVNSLKVHNIATNINGSVAKWVRRLTSCKDYHFQMKDWTED